MMDKSNSFSAQDIDPTLNQKLRQHQQMDADTTRAQNWAKSNTSIKQTKMYPSNTRHQAKVGSTLLNQHRSNVSRLRDIDVF